MRLDRPRRFSAARRIVFAAAIAFATGDCSLNVEVNDPNMIVKSGGDSQTAPTNTPLPTPFSVVVVDQFGEPLMEVTVTWTILSGGGSLNETSNKTVDGGVSSVTYTTGPTAGTATIEAKVIGVPPVTFTVTIT